MKNWLIVLFLPLLAACSQVPPGYVGIKVNLYGGGKGVDHEVLPVGRYWIGMNEQLYTFPTFQQNYVWTSSAYEGDGASAAHPDSVDESIEFGAAQGVDVHANVGISFHVNPEKISEIFQKYREGLNEIRAVPLRNAVRNAFVKHGAGYTVDQLNGADKAKLSAAVLAEVRDEFKPLGIEVDSISLVGNFKLPPTVTAALNAKIQATQEAEQAQNEVAKAIANANKAREEARGLADANRIKAASLTPQLIEWEKLQRWKGDVPQVMGGGSFNMIELTKGSK